MSEIYLDNAATTPATKNVVRKVMKCMNNEYANPSSKHTAGIRARKIVEQARKELADEIGVKSHEIVFTSSGTESNAIALIGAARAQKGKGRNKIIISSIEHSSIYENAIMLKKEGFDVVEIPVSESKGLDRARLEKEVDHRTAIVSVMHANSETGIVNDIALVAKICKNKGAIFHTDALQSFGKIKLQAKNVGIDMLSAASHKIGGVKGAAILYVREGVDIEPIYCGGGQERGMRSGTQNTAAIAGFAAALEEHKKVDWAKVEKLRDYMQDKLEGLGARITAKSSRRLATHLHVTFRNVNGEDMVNYLSTKGIYCSTGSACDSNKNESRVLASLEIPGEYIRGALRISLSPSTSKADIDKAVKEIGAYLNKFKNAL